MGTRKRYRKKAGQFVVAVQLNLETDGFVYHKWGDEQHCKPGDWLVDNGSDIYTIDQKEFDDTYKKIESGRYKKTAPIWAEVATQPGVVKTTEGRSHYKAGDFLVSSDADGAKNPYCIPAKKFHVMYEPYEQTPSDG